VTHGQTRIHNRCVGSETANEHPSHAEGCDAAGNLATIFNDAGEDALLGAGFAIVGRWSETTSLG
jgi:hypothetical protein